MAITMQGFWNISVKSKDAAKQQRFILAGTNGQDNVYDGTVGNSVWVNGTSWTITIQNQTASGWKNSTEKITFPSNNFGFYQFDILSDDAGGSAGPDFDFNDLILTCKTPATGSDFLVYGSVSYYNGLCFNPCRRDWVILDTPLHLAEALRNQSLSDVITKLYPERVHIKVNQNPPDPTPDFTPMMIPLREETALPLKAKMEIRTTPSQYEYSNVSKKKDAQSYSYDKLVGISTLPQNYSVASQLNASDKLAVATIADKYHLFPSCETGVVPHAILQFQEYDRTNTELNGGAYSGMGNRENLGSAVTDAFGNYIFRFTRSFFDSLDEVFNDTASGESTSITYLPDVLVQLKDPLNVLYTLYESALYPNVPFLKRIDLCVPKSKSGLIPLPCHGQHIIQRVGNTFVGPMQWDGTRHDAASDTYLTENGIISINSNGVVYPSSPVLKCCAWGGGLAVWGCLDNPDITHYTVRFKNHAASDIHSNWNFITDGLALPAFVWNPATFSFEMKNMPTSIQKNLSVDGNPSANTPAFLNAETDGSQNWLATGKNLKAVLSSSAYTATPGPVDFKIDGFDAAGNQLAWATEKITLYIDNSSIDLFVDENMSMAGIAKNNCALFTLPKDGSGTTIGNEPLQVKFRAVLASGFMDSYSLSMNKGATGNFPVSGSAGEDISKSYPSTPVTACTNNFKGTVEEASADITGNYIVHLQPTSGNWLTDTQNFCAFGVNLSAGIRRTDGNNSSPLSYYGNQVLIGIQK